MKNNLIVMFYFIFAINTFSQTTFTTAKPEEKTKSKITYTQYDITLA